MSRLLRVARNVTELAGATLFYQALGFVTAEAPRHDAALAAVLGVSRALSQRLRLGAQQLELTQLSPQGAAYPPGLGSGDAAFQHIAIVTRDIFALQQLALRAGAVPISHEGPQTLPKASGGVIAWKFRDPDGHPLELLQMPDAPSTAALTSGYDHSAIGVTDVARSIGFYQALGLALGHRHVNRGPAQARLDGLQRGMVDVVAMLPHGAPPHLELLGYPGTILPAVPMVLADIAADRLVFAGAPGELVLRRDPDGHVLLLDGRI
jgi:catechol 2,3-dioxygenase-like lactoylglutathione lyase family enzyme